MTDNKIANEINETPQSVLEFWFGCGRNAGQIQREKGEMWFKKNARVDEQITRRFAGLSEIIYCGGLQEWQQFPTGMLAAILSQDQFPRNMYRGTERAFRYDDMARSLAQKMVDTRQDLELAPIQRVFVYLPFEHSENLEDQYISIQLNQELCDVVDESEKKLFENFYDYARRHYEIIREFGRYPHRNSILQRTSTDKELEFLQKPGSSF